MEDDLDSREAERVRRRDRDAQEKERQPMRTGIGKVFKQIQDAQLKAAKKATGKRPSSGRGS